MDNLKFCFAKQKVWHQAGEYGCWPQNTYLSALICQFLTKDGPDGQTSPEMIRYPRGKEPKFSEETRHPPRSPGPFTSVNNEAPFMERWHRIG